MQKTTFIGITAAALVAAFMAWWLSGSQQPGDSVVSDDALFPGLQQRINEIGQIEISGPQGAIATLSKGDGQWELAQRDGYAADWASVKDLLKQLAEAQIIERKTSRAELYQRLGVQDVDAGDAEGLLVRLDNDPELALIVGFASTDKTGRYVRLAGSEQALLVNQRLTMPKETGAWLHAEILDIPASRIDEVYIRHANGEVVHGQRNAEDESNFILGNKPEDRELASQWAVNAFPNSLTGVTIEDVARATEDPPEDAIRVLFVADNGLNLQLELYQQEEQYWMQVSANAEPVAAANDQDADNGEAAADATLLTSDSEQVAVSTETVIDAASEAAALNERLGPWVFRIPEYKYNAWAKTMEDILAPLPEAAGDADDAADAAVDES